MRPAYPARPGYLSRSQAVIDSLGDSATVIETDCVRATRLSDVDLAQALPQPIPSAA